MAFWQVFQLDKQGRELRRVFVRAKDKETARAVGNYGLRVTGARSRYVSVHPYHPERDYEIQRYVRQVEG